MESLILRGSEQSMETEIDALYEAMYAASKRLKALSGGGFMNLTPDSVKASLEYITAKADYQRAFAAVRAANSKKAVR